MRRRPPCEVHVFHGVTTGRWAVRAFIESLVVRLKDPSPLVAAASDYLARMKGIAGPFDLAKVDFYKALYRKMTSGLTPVMELAVEDGASVGDSTIPCSAPPART